MPSQLLLLNFLTFIAQHPSITFPLPRYHPTEKSARLGHSMEIIEKKKKLQSFLFKSRENIFETSLIPMRVLRLENF